MRSEHFYQTVIRDALAKRREKNPRYSLRAFSRSLSIDPGMLSRVISGLRVPTPDFSKKILPHLELTSAAERKFLESVAKANKVKSFVKNRAALKKILYDEQVSVPRRNLSPDLFYIISDWYHYAILQLTETEGFESSAEWIAKALGIKAAEARKAIDRLKSCGFIQEVAGVYVRVTPSLTAGDLTVTTAAHQKRIRQVSEKSLLSLRNHPIRLRNHTTVTVAIDPARINLAKEMIQDFMGELCEVMQTKKKTVYELQINFFPLQEVEL